MKDRTHPKDYLKLIQEMDANERKVWEKMLSYDEKYFADMRFETKDLQRKFARIEIQDEKGKWHDRTVDAPMYLDVDSVNEWMIRLVDNIDGTSLAICDNKNMVIKILKKTRGGKELEETLLHEMIHIYEFIYRKNDAYRSYEQFLVLYFYDKLKKRIGGRKLNKFIEVGLNFEMIGVDICYHSLLFLFKSLDLDLRLKKPFGTIYAYRREEFFK